MTPELQYAQKLADLALRLGRVNRVTLHPDGVRPETDTDHTVMLGLIACELAWAAWPRVCSVSLVVEFSLVHDLVEAYCGDVQTLTINNAGRAAKKEREHAALARILQDAPPWLSLRLQQYEAQQQPEARFVRLLDKVMPKLTHAANGCIGARNLGVTREQFEALHQKQYEDLSAEYPEFPRILALLRESMDHAQACWQEP